MTFDPRRPALEDAALPVPRERVEDRSGLLDMHRELGAREPVARDPRSDQQPSPTRTRAWTVRASPPSLKPPVRPPAPRPAGRSSAHAAAAEHRSVPVKVIEHHLHRSPTLLDRIVLGHDPPRRRKRHLRHSLLRR